MNTIENNKLIAEFMGGLYNNQSRLSLQSNEIWLPYHGVCNYKSDNGKSLNYHNDWNWLMQVVEKIESLDGNIHICNNDIFVHFPKRCRELIRVDGGRLKINKIEAVYNACIAFIEWYNENSAEEKY